MSGSNTWSRSGDARVAGQQQQRIAGQQQQRIAGQPGAPRGPGAAGGRLGYDPVGSIGASQLQGRPMPGGRGYSGSTGKDGQDDRGGRGGGRGGWTAMDGREAGAGGWGGGRGGGRGAERGTGRGGGGKLAGQDDIVGQQLHTSENKNYNFNMFKVGSRYPGLVCGINQKSRHISVSIKAGGISEK